MIDTGGCYAIGSSAGILQSVSESQERLNSFEKKQRDHPTGKDLSVIRYGT